MTKLGWLASCAVATAATAAAVGAALRADEHITDFGLFVQNELHERADDLFGIEHPLAKSVLGPFNGADSTLAIKVADPLKVSLVSSAVAPTADMIALWPDDEHPTHLFVCIEAGGNPSVQRVDLSGPPNANATTIVTGLVACDPIRRTAWGTIVAGEEATDGGLYEIIQPLGINAPIAVTNRATGATSDPRVVKRKAVGQLAFEGNPLLPDGTMYYGDELRPNTGTAGGGIFKFVPDIKFAGGPPITLPSESPLVSGRIFSLRLGTNGTPDNGQGTEIGQGSWVEVIAALFLDANGNIKLRDAQKALKSNGYYRPEDMEFDPVALEHDIVRPCWTDTGRMTNGGGSVEEGASIYGEVMCLTDEADPQATGFAIPTVRRFWSGDPHANFFDNVAFQPKSGRLIVLEDGEVEVVKKDGTTELRGNDIWFCLPDGRDRDVQTDGCVRIASLTDTASEPTGFIFTASGRTAYVNLQHRSTNTGALLKITGFRVRDHRDHEDGDHDDDDHGHGGHKDK